jgi:hypothetical protein
MEASRPQVAQQHHRAWPPRTGESYKNGKYYHFDQREILVMTSWPDPRAWRRTKTIDWKRTRKHADQALTLFDMTLPEQSPVDHFVNKFRPDPRGPNLLWDQSQSGLDKAEAIFSHMSASVNKVEDIFGADFPWPAEITEQDRNCYKGAANSQLVRTSYLRQIPENVRILLHPLRERRWQMLNLLARCPGASDLSISNPGLAFALANNWCFHQPSVSQPSQSAPVCSESEI